MQSSQGFRNMKLFKLDLMTVLIVVVALGVVVTMSTQAGDSRSMENIAGVSAQALGAADVVKP